MTAVQIVLWAVAGLALLRLVYAVAWLIPHRDACARRHPAGRHRTPKETP